jgi:hypothetical protein
MAIAVIGPIPGMVCKRAVFSPPRRLTPKCLLNLGDLLSKEVDLLEIEAAEISDDRRERALYIVDHIGEWLKVRLPLRRDDPVLGEMAPERIDELGALAHEEVACTKDHQSSLLLLGLDSNKAHRRP